MPKTISGSATKSEQNPGGCTAEGQQINSYTHRERGPQEATQPATLPWKTAVFWMMRNLSSMLADWRSCSMLDRARTWYFSSIFREQHVGPLGRQTCKSNPAHRQQRHTVSLVHRPRGQASQHHQRMWGNCLRLNQTNGSSSSILATSSSGVSSSFGTWGR